MSLDKAIKHGKEKRKQYYDSRAFDCTCRNHGSCSYCTGSRLHASKKQYGKIEDQEDEYHYACLGGGDPTDVDMDMSDELMERFGFDPNDRYDMVRSGLWWNPKIEEELEQNGETIL
jgi:5-methylcytosine-specific restriction endonuclease McrA